MCTGGGYFSKNNLLLKSSAEQRWQERLGKSEDPETAFQLRCAVDVGKKATLHAFQLSGSVLCLSHSCIFSLDASFKHSLNPKQDVLTRPALSSATTALLY